MAGAPKKTSTTRGLWATLSLLLMVGGSWTLWAPVATVSTVALLSSGCPGDSGEVCQCLVCAEDTAIAIDVADEEGVEVEDFVVEVLFNGENLGQPEGCSAEARDGDNACTFGSELGVYQVVVLAPGYERYEAAVRISDEGEREVCCRACLTSRELGVVLKARE